MALQRKNYSHLPRPVGAYVHAVQASGMLYLSGLTAFGMPEQDQGLAAEARAVFTQIGLIAEAEGTSLASLVKVTIFVTREGSGTDRSLSMTPGDDFLDHRLHR
jgi:2-iminobutanoate/2-iminopropanoate deaminase